MLDQLFKGLFDTEATAVIAPGDFLLCLSISLFMGIILSACYAFRSRYTKSFLFTLALLPSVVCVVIMMVNGNIGTGVAVAGAFSLVRFRSAPGTAKEIGALFLAMGAGLIAGMGYLAYAVLFALLMGLVTICFNALSFKGTATANSAKTLTITIPESLEYTDIFADIFERYTAKQELVRVKTTNMGSMYKLTYHITLKAAAHEKAMIDDLRCRNGNLEISVSPQEYTVTEL